MCPSPWNMNGPKRLKVDARLRSILSDSLIDDIPLTAVYVAKIHDPKKISKIIVELNNILPIPELCHLKRMKGLEIMISPTSMIDSEEELLQLLKTKKFDTSNLGNFRKVQVAKIPPKVRKQYDMVNKLWPCNFHSNPYLEKLSTNTIFSEKELDQHSKYMRIAIDITKITNTKNSAIVIDPEINSIVAFGFEQDSPIKHSIMIAIDNVARAQNGGVWLRHSLEDKVEDYIKTQYKDIEFGISADTENGPYLCTNYTLYVTHEPCIVCAMALIHSRIKRVFYGAPRANGALGTKCKIHVVENLNHHYEVFAGLLEDECQLL